MLIAKLLDLIFMIDAVQERDASDPVLSNLHQTLSTQMKNFKTFVLDLYHAYRTHNVPPTSTIDQEDSISNSGAGSQPVRKWKSCSHGLKPDHALVKKWVHTG